MSSIDEQFVEFLVKSLVSNPDAVVIERRIDEKGVLLELTVDPEDLGRVIGKRGATAQSLRTLLRALGTKNEARYNLKIIDNGTGVHAHDDSQQPISTIGSNGTTLDEPAVAATQASEDTDRVNEAATASGPKDSKAASPASSDQTSDRVLQTRKELADLDDLDL